MRAAAAALPLLVVCALLLGTGADILPHDAIVSVGEVELTLSRILILAALAALVALERERRDLFASGLGVPLALLVLAGLASTLEWGTEPRFRFLLESVALFYLVFALARGRPAVAPAIAAVALVSVSLAAFPGLAQIAQDRATGFYRDGCEPVTAAPPLVPPGTITRATGSFSNPNLLAGQVLLLAPLGALLVGLVLRRRRREGARGEADVADARDVELGGAGAGQLALGLGLAVALSYGALFLTYSRAAVFFGLIAIGAAALASGMRHRGTIAAVGVGLALASAFAFAACGSEAGAGYGRGQEWSDTIQLARDNPLRGVGLGRVGDVLRAGDPRATTQHAHNLWLNWWAEAGTAALVAWIWIFVALLWRTAGAARRRGDPVAVAAFAALLGFAGFSLLDHPANVDRVAIAFWVVAGLAASVGPGAGRGWLRSRLAGARERSADPAEERS